MATKRGRIRSPHPGVLLLKRKLPSERISWFVRFRDPDDEERTKYQALAPLGLSTHEARRQWAIQKSKSLAARRAELKSGAPKLTRTPLDDAVNKFLESCRDHLRPNTVATYSAGIDRFVKWAKRSGISHVEDLNSGKLREFRSALVASGRQVAARGFRRGARRTIEAKQSPTSVNIHLTSVKVMLNEWRLLNKLPNLDRDGITDSLKRLEVPSNPPAYLPASDCRRLLEAALRHDRETFKATREEHAGFRPLGFTPRHVTIAPFITFVLLSGCRRGEALALKWDNVDLEALDHTGEKVGEIRLRAEETKTKRARTIGLEVSPALHRMLSAMKLQNGSERYVFGGSIPFPVDLAESARDRLINTFGAPSFNWQNLRQTTGTFLTNAPRIYGSASVFMSAKQLGHSVAIAEKHYLGVYRGISRDAHTLEAAMQIEEVMTEIKNEVSRHSTSSTTKRRARNSSSKR